MNGIYLHLNKSGLENSMVFVSNFDTMENVSCEIKKDYKNGEIISIFIDVFFTSHSYGNWKKYQKASKMKPVTSILIKRLPNGEYIAKSIDSKKIEDIGFLIKVLEKDSIHINLIS